MALRWISASNKPHLSGGTTLVPLRAFMQTAGATVDYNAASFDTAVKYKGKTFTFPKHGEMVFVDGKEQKLDKSMIQSDGARYVPFAF
jgi:hypothetical protein